MLSSKYYYYLLFVYVKKKEIQYNDENEISESIFDFFTFFFVVI